MEAKKDHDSVDLRVPRRLRELRIQRGMTLEDVAARASIDISTLSRLESGKRRLALDHLPRLAAALSVSTDELLRETEHPDPRVRGTSHTRHGVWYWPLTRHGPAGGPHERDFIIKPGEAVEFSTWTPHWFGTVDGPAEAIMIFGPHGERLHLYS
jgi:transcriptional regulator with XRE-family HTH domain